MTRQPVITANAPAAIGAYSQAVRAGNTVYLSGQIPLIPSTMEIVEGTHAQIHQVFKNLSAVAAAAGGGLENVVKLTVYLGNLDHFASVNEIMGEYFEAPYPARAAIGVASLPKGASIEVEGVMVL